MNPRLARQLVYGSIFFAIIFFVVIGIYVRSFKPTPSCFDEKLNQEEEQIDCGGPCIDCAVRNLERITALAELVPVGDTVSMLIKFTNPNIFYGSPRFNYTLTLYDLAGEELTKLTRESFIYPGEFDKTIIEANLPVSLDDIGFDPEVIISSPDWLSAEGFSQPETALRQKSFVFSELGDKIEASGIIINRNPFALTQVDVGAIVYKGRRIVGVSRTLLQNLEPFSERFFKILIPVSPSDVSEIDLNSTEIEISARQ